MNLFIYTSIYGCEPSFAKTTGGILACSGGIELSAPSPQLPAPSFQPPAPSSQRPASSSQLITSSSQPPALSSHCTAPSSQLPVVRFQLAAFSSHLAAPSSQLPVVLFQLAAFSSHLAAPSSQPPDCVALLHARVHGGGVFRARPDFNVYNNKKLIETIGPSADDLQEATLTYFRSAVAYIYKKYRPPDPSPPQNCASQAQRKMSLFSAFPSGPRFRQLVDTFLPCKNHSKLLNKFRMC